MKVAFCLSGQQRTWQKCYSSWPLLFERFKKEILINNKVVFSNYQNEIFEVDYFIHTWDFNTTDSKSKTKISTNISKTKIEEMLNTIKPKAYLIEDIEKSKSRENMMNSISKNGNSHLNWTASQLYSIMMSAHLKKQYEIENKFKYDMCIRSRFDLNFNENNRMLFVRDFTPIQKKTVYSVWNAHNPAFRWPYSEIGDIFYYSDSATFDLITSIYDAIPHIPYETFPADVKIEEIMVYFIRTFMLNNQHLMISPDIVRQNISLI